MAKNKTVRPADKLKKLAREAGVWLTSIGDIERLAGINTCSELERRELWDRFRHLYSGPSQDLIDAVMDYCAAIALKRIKNGELCFARQFP